jgi:hypothetical protein
VALQLGGVGCGVNNTSPYKKLVTKTSKEPRTWTYSLDKRPKLWRLLGRPRRRWVDNIRMDLGEVGWGDVDWICLAKDRNRWRALVNSVLDLRVP